MSTDRSESHNEIERVITNGTIQALEGGALSPQGGRDFWIKYLPARINHRISHN